MDWELWGRQIVVLFGLLSVIEDMVERKPLGCCVLARAGRDYS